MVSGLACFPLPPGAAKNLANFVLDGQRWSLVGTEAPHWDTSVIGRELSRPGHSIEWRPAAFQVRQLQRPCARDVCVCACVW